MRKILVAAAVSVLASCGLSSAALAARRSPVDLHTPTGGALSPGAPVTFSSSNFIFESSGGERLKCTEAKLEGTLNSNDAATVTATITSAKTASEPFVGCEAEPAQVEAEHLPIQAVGLPWTATISNRNTVVIAGSSGVGFQVTGGRTCTWSGKRILGLTLAPYGFMSTAAASQKLRLERGAPCWSKGPANANVATFSGEWSLTSEGGEEVLP